VLGRAGEQADGCGGAANIRRVHIFGDNDDPGRDAARNAVNRYCHREFRHVTVHWPDDAYNDWNDVLMGRPTHAENT
jgi:hypothetical protein